MGNFQRDDNRGGGFRGGNGGGKPNFQKRNFGGNRGGDRGPVVMNKAVCDECHKNCEVPFRPSGDKPVYCSDCFMGKKGDDRGPRKDFGDRGPRREFNDRPAPQAPFSKPASAPMQDDMKKQLGEISAKLDRLTTAIEKLAVSKDEKKVEKVAEIKKTPIVKTIAKKVVKKVLTKKKK